MMKVTPPPVSWEPPSKELAQERRKKVFRWIHITSNMSYEQLAGRFDTTERTWGSWMKGAKPRPDSVAIISEETGILPEVILGEVEWNP